MASDDERVSVQTYVPASQQEQWRKEADRMDMSQAEYVRTMVQAGRRGFDIYTDDGDLNSDTGSPSETGLEDGTPGVDGLKDRVLDVLRSMVRHPGFGTSETGSGVLSRQYGLYYRLSFA
jgi:hypothetical protein